MATHRDPPVTSQQTRVTVPRTTPQNPPTTEATLISTTAGALPASTQASQPDASTRRGVRFEETDASTSSRNGKNVSASSANRRRAVSFAPGSSTSKLRVNIIHRSTHSAAQNRLVGGHFEIDRRQAALSARDTVARHTRSMTRQLQAALQAQRAKHVFGDRELAMQEEAKKVAHFQRLCERQGVAVYRKQREVDELRRTAARMRDENEQLSRAVAREAVEQEREVEKMTQTLQSFPSGARLLTPVTSRKSMGISRSGGVLLSPVNALRRESVHLTSSKSARREEFSKAMADKRQKEEDERRARDLEVRRKVKSQEARVKELRRVLEDEQQSLSRYRVETQEAQRQLEQEAEGLTRQLRQIRRSQASQKAEEELSVLARRIRRLERDCVEPKHELQEKEKRAAELREQEAHEDGRLDETNQELKKQKSINERLDKELDVRVYKATKGQFLEIAKRHEVRSLVDKLRTEIASMDELLACDGCENNASKPPSFSNTDPKPKGAGHDQDDHKSSLQSSWLRFSDNSVWCDQCAHTRFGQEIVDPALKDPDSTIPPHNTTRAMCANHAVDDFEIRFDMLRSQAAVVEKLHAKQREWMEL